MVSLILIIHYSSSSGSSEVDMPFPTLTICPEYDPKYKAYFTLQEKYDDEDDKDLTDAQYFEEITKSSSEIIESIEINTLKPKKVGGESNSKFKYYKNDWLSDGNVNGFNSEHFGKCYSFSVPDDIKSLEAKILF